MQIDIYSPEIFVPGVPHEQFRWLRDNAPVHYTAVDVPDEGPGFWSFTRFEDIVRASKDYKTFANGGGTNIHEPVQGVNLMLINQDPPDHTRLRATVSKGFHPKMIAALEQHIRDIVTRILDRVAPKGECDFVTDIAAELPLEVIAEFMGVPVEDRHKIFTWSNTMIAQGGDPEYGATIEDATRAFFEMSDYANWLAEQRRQGPKDDLVTKIISAEIDGEKLTELEYDMFFVMLAIAGNETTRNLISGGMRALIEHPEQRRLLLEDHSLFGNAVEEMLRWVTPVMHFRRTTACEVTVHDQTIGPGEKVLLWYASGNRDGRSFDEPDAFDVRRTPNPHVTFGAGGPHFCLGFSLAQLEIRVMFEELLRRMPDMEFDGEIQRLHSNFINGIRHMPVRFTPERV